MSCPYWRMFYLNPDYAIYQGEPEMIQQGYVFWIGDKFEALSCALAINSIGRRPETLQLISPAFDIDIIGRELGVLIRLIDIKADTISFTNVPCFSMVFPIESKGFKKEIYVGISDGYYYTISKRIDPDREQLYAQMFHKHGRALIY